MALTYSSVIISSVAGDNTINGAEASDGFSILGTGAFSNGSLKNGDSITVTITWDDPATGTKSQANFTATASDVVKSGSNGTFNWTINETSTQFSNLALVLGAGTVKVTFPGSVNSNTFDYTFACFLRGTRVLTRHGYCPVEELAVGDEVRTLSGGWQPLRWIGHQRITTPFGLAKGAPVRITAGAFGPALPERDVCVSQDHAVFFRNQLIPARFLVNGITVFRDTSVKDIEYFHLLLDQHAVIFSEGLATESYVPCENIDWFDNTAECPQALLNAIRAGTAECLSECYPRKTTGPAVEAARALLARFAPADAKERAVG
ncbi:Hint domain-containing protein [Nitrosomonas sp. Nm34]|uniref:Hint domain-containing protein n=1 Tax=Nitrosomonas sp. Nm34 TaxID=1881055 RepID=UPI0008ED4959|nr:Hint domain-containing protein [Nitrosomonas sp. Nm34]SFI32264.1 Hint domain-containing protein [Nitrosomonas sp. Nm34]